MNEAHLSISEEKELTDILNNLGCLTSFTKLDENNFHVYGELLTKFNNLFTNGSIDIASIYEIAKGQTLFSLIIIRYKAVIEHPSPHGIPRREHLNELYPYILCDVKGHYGKTIIRPETITDKILELLSRTEIDFDCHKGFSKNYHVLTDKEEYLRKKLDSQKLEIINKYNDLLIEFSESECLIRDHKAMREDNLSKLILTTIDLLGNNL